ncbi:MAG: MBL fold metallo-hydrolase [Halieaceae bacterium]|nr:MBL fold metallo-hydrolase [Halieaceae bacterium]
MTSHAVQQLPGDIACIDAQYVDSGLACVYLVRSGDEYALIETGTSHTLAAVQAAMSARGIQPEQIKYVIPTHAHLDHAGGAGVMMRAFPEAELLAHPQALKHLCHPERLIASAKSVYGEALFQSLYGEILPVPESRATALADGQTIIIGERELVARHTPGHANHHLCVWDAQTRGWFTGDMFGVCYGALRLLDGPFVVPSTSPTQFDPAAFQGSLDVLADASPDCMYLTHYSAIPWSPATHAALSQQVSDYASIAAEHENDTSGLATVLMRYTLDRLRDRLPGQDLASCEEQLVADMGLNAQGLTVWLKRRAA